MDRVVFFHVDMDSPRILAKYWGVDDADYDETLFFKTAWERMLSFFKSESVPATFFMIGEDLERHDTCREGLLRAHREGHEIANHTYSHPFGLTRLDPGAMAQEVRKAGDQIERLTGTRPAGFRSPGYDIDGNVLRELSHQGYCYDSSVSWSMLNSVAKLYHRIHRNNDQYEGYGESSFKTPRGPYFPDLDDWAREGSSSDARLLEMPLPSTRVARLPFYFNFHLSMGEAYQNFAIRGMRQPCVVYLIHLIEFFDMEDDIPRGIRKHPNVEKSRHDKLRALKNAVRSLQKRYVVARTDEYVRQTAKSMLGSTS